MYVTSIRVRGFRDLPSFEAKDLGRVVALKGADPASTALGDAVELAFAALSSTHLERLLQRWQLVGGTETATIDRPDLPTQATWKDPWGARAIVADDTHRHLDVALGFALDPGLFGQLRTAQAREPRLASLGDSAAIELRVGALFNVSYDALAIHVQGLAVGSEVFGLEPECPPWLGDVLRAMGRRFARHPVYTDVESRLLDASLARQGHDAYRGWQSALRPDFGVVRPVAGVGGHPSFYADDLPLRRFGRPGVERASLAASATLSGADILWAETDDSWVDGMIEGQPSPLEQVIRVTANGTVAVASDDPSPAREPLRLDPPKKRGS